jgi:hypothetical protein
MQKNYGAISAECQRANAEEIWIALRGLIGNVLGVQPSQLTRDMNFVKDLGID